MTGFVKKLNNLRDNYSTCKTVIPSYTQFCYLSFLMKRSSPLLFLSICFFVIFMTSCRTPKDLEFREFNNLSLENVSFMGATLKVDLVYYNPNNFGLELNRTDLDIFVDSTYLGHSNQDIQVAIPKRDIFTVPLKVELDMKNLLKNGINSFFSKTVNVRVTGKVKVGKAGVFKSFNVDYQTTQTIPSSF